MQGAVCVCVCSQAGGCVCVRACFPGGAWPWARAREARGARPPARLERERGWGWPAPLALTGNCFSLYLSLSLNSAPDAAGPPTPSLPAGCACPPARAHRPRGGGVRDGEEGQGRRGRKACGRACFFFLGALPVLSRPAHARPSPAPPAPLPPFQTSGSAEFEGGVGAATFRAPAAPARPKQSSRGRPGVAAFEGGTGKAIFASR